MLYSLFISSPKLLLGAGSEEKPAKVKVLFTCWRGDFGSVIYVVTCVSYICHTYDLSSCHGSDDFLRFLLHPFPVISIISVCRMPCGSIRTCSHSLLP